MFDFWIQLENHAWDVCPNDLGRDRMTSQTAQERPGGQPPVMKTLTSPITRAHHDQTMFQPLSQDALIFRRYTENWAAPADRKVNPWDLNEPDPTDGGTMGTIPGATIECSVGDDVAVHFRNMDTRSHTVMGVGEELLPVLQRMHSMHAHGILFAATFDGAYPLSPPDATQLVPHGPQTPGSVEEQDQAAWTAAGFAEGAPKQGDRVPPGGTFTYTWQTLGWPTTAGVWLYHDHSIYDDDNMLLGAIGILVIHNPSDPQDFVLTNADFPVGDPNGSPVDAGVYRIPPNDKAQYLQLFHMLKGAGMVINGRKYLGQGPTVVAGPTTLMRFGVVGMGSDTHTFHIHGHRWILPGPGGTTDGSGGAGNVQDNPTLQAVSQFEDTRVFGPASSFTFTIQEGSSFMGAQPPEGEWHMHCHVLDHMMDGMMGSLLVVYDQQAVTPLPHGVPLPMSGMPGNGGIGMVTIGDNFFQPANVQIVAGETVTWTNSGGAHTVTSNGHMGANFVTCMPVSTEDFDSGAAPIAHNATFQHMFPTPGTYAYHCDIHGCTMDGAVAVT